MNPSCSIAASTRARVSGRTRSGWFSTFETVPTATPARLATSFMPAAISPSGPLTLHMLAKSALGVPS